MQVLKVGSRGNDVRLWQQFLNIKGFDAGTADGIFGFKTRMATAAYQQKKGIGVDGCVGSNTLRKAYADRFPSAAPVASASGKREVVAPVDPSLFPSKPDFTPISESSRNALFGGFNFTKNPDGSVTILGNWQAINIIPIEIPQLKGVTNPYSSKPFGGRVYFHRKAKEQLVGLFNELEKEGLHKLVLTWGGSFVPRLVRGSSTRLSNHSYGTAFDINMQWNGLGQQPALVGERGTVRQIVSIANRYGFFWGGHYNTRKDGMHFEIAKLL
ncbi:MAG: M15 family metallopeptidase [Bacteroidales bacterium]|nr:M15 family metallopeptidase [Bacteroidales bacterium]MBN2750388.1 M15 family metallopeptidase [Bacteroidales bacterium]